MPEPRLEKLLFTKISDDLQVQITIKDMDKELHFTIGKHAPTPTAQSWSVRRKGPQTVQLQ